MIRIYVERASVCMGDDVTAPNEETFFFAQDEPIYTLMQNLCDYVPKMRNVVWEIFCNNTAFGYLISDDTGKYQYETLESVRFISELPESEIFCKYHYKNIEDIIERFNVMNRKG